MARDGFVFINGQVGKKYADEPADTPDFDTWPIHPTRFDRVAYS